MPELQLDIWEYETPIVSQKVIDAGFCFESFGGPSATAEDVAAQSTGKLSYKDNYENILWRAAGIIDSAAQGAPLGAQAAVAELQQLLCSCDLPILKMQISGWIFDLCIASDMTYLVPEFCHCDPICKDFMIFSFVKSIILGEPNEEKLMLALPYICGYDYRASRYYKENTELYRKVFAASLPEFVRTLLSEYGKEIFTPEFVKMRRTAFDGVPCKPQSVKVFEIEYLSFSGCELMFQTITSAVKCCDNLVRQSLGESSRLSGISLSANQRRFISGSIRENIPGLLPEMRRVGRKPKVPDVKKKIIQKEAIEKLDLDIDFSIANDLLEKSFELSELLGTFEEDEETVTLGECIGFANPAKENDEDTVLSGDSEWLELACALTEDEKQILSCLIVGGDVNELSRRLSGMPLGFADAINEKAQDICGDIVIEEQGGRLCVISDYREILTELIKP